MRRFDISKNSIIWAFKDATPVYAGKVGNEEYRPFTDDIDGAIRFLSQASEPSTNSLNKYLGDATPNSKRNMKLSTGFGKKVGDYTGVFFEGDDDTYYKIEVSLTATYGGGSEVAMAGYGWVKESDISNDEKEIDAAVEAGDVNVTKLELARLRAEAAKAEAEAAANKNSTKETPTADKQPLIDSNSNSSQSSPNWLLIGGIFAGVLIVGGGFLYALRTPKTP